MTRTRIVPRALERLLIVVVAVGIAVGVIAVLSGGLLGGRDDPGVSTQQGPGVAYRDQGDTHLSAGTADPAYDSNPPTSGAHVVAPVTRDGATLSDDQLLTALGNGDVVLLYGTPRPPPGLAALATAVSGPFSPALAAGGGAVILARRPGASGVIALAWTRALRAAANDEAPLRSFAQFWLGRGASR